MIVGIGDRTICYLYELIIELFNMPKAIKAEKHQTCGKGWCNEHIFEIFPISKTARIKRKQKIRMCPILNINSKKFNKPFPLYNRDSKFYTPSFMLEEDKNFDQQKDQRYKNNHLRRLSENPSGISQMFVPNLAHKNKFCNVCRMDFDDYLDHISSCSHKKNLKANKFTNHIAELSKKYLSIRQLQISKQPTLQTGIEESSQLQNSMSKQSKKGLEVTDFSKQIIVVGQYD